MPVLRRDRIEEKQIMRRPDILFRFKELHTAANMPVSEKRNGKALPDKKGLKSMKDFLHDFFNPPKFVKPTETKKVFACIQDHSQYLY